MKTLLLTITLLICPFLHANPAPFGLELNKTTLHEAKKQYSLIENGTNLYSNGPMYYLNSKELKLEGLKKVLLIFSEKENVLLCVVATFDKNKFNSINNNLSKKYRLTKEKIPFVGNKYVEYQDDESLIMLEAPHMSFDLDVTYAVENFINSFDQAKQSDNEQKNKNEFNSL